MQYVQGKKEEKLTELALLYGKAKWRLFNTATTPWDGFVVVFTFDDVMPPADRCSICSLYVRCTIRNYAEPFHAKLHHICVRSTILHYTEPFHATLHRLCVRCATRRYPEPFDATQHRLYTVLQMSAKLWASPFHNVPTRHGQLDRLLFG